MIPVHLTTALWNQFCADLPFYVRDSPGPERLRNSPYVTPLASGKVRKHTSRLTQTSHLKLHCPGAAAGKQRSGRCGEINDVSLSRVGDGMRQQDGTHQGARLPGSMGWEVGVIFWARACKRKTSAGERTEAGTTTLWGWGACSSGFLSKRMKVLLHLGNRSLPDVCTWLSSE